jgi:hypothetical protein
MAMVEDNSALVERMQEYDKKYWDCPHCRKGIPKDQIRESVAGDADKQGAIRELEGLLDFDRKSRAGEFEEAFQDLIGEIQSRLKALKGEK